MTLEFLNQCWADPALLLKRLIQFDTTSGVSPEEPAIIFIKDLLAAISIESKLIYREKSRPNLLATIPAGQSEKQIPPLLLYGHIDVVSTTGQNWSVDPFAGIVKDNALWGRGAIDMKGELVMFLFVLFQIKRQNIQLPFELRLLIVSDEECSSNFGTKFLVKEHPAIFDGVRYALGEIGGFSLYISGKKLYPIMIAEKQFAHISITASGDGGHASMAQGKTAMELIADCITLLSKHALRVRTTPAVTEMIQAMAQALGGIQGIVLKQLLNPLLTDKILKLLGSSGQLFAPLLHNSLNITIIKGGDAINVIPAKVSCECDLRIVPGCTIEDALNDIRQVIGDEYDIQVIEYDKNITETDMKLFNSLKEALKSKDPEALPIPFVLAAVTDGRFLSALGIQSYGFTPMKLPKDYDFTSMAHNADERIPLDALPFGIETLADYIIHYYEKEF